MHTSKSAKHVLHSCDDFSFEGGNILINILELFSPSSRVEWIFSCFFSLEVDQELKQMWQKFMSFKNTNSIFEQR